MLSQIVLILWGLVMLVVLLQYGGMLESLRAFKGAGVKLALAIATLGTLGAAYYRGAAYMTPEREGWIVRGRSPGDSVSLGFDTKSRFRSMGQPLGRVLDRNGVLLAGYKYDGHLKRSYPAGHVTAHIVGYWTGPLRDGVGIEKALTLVNDSLHDDMPHDLKLTLDLRLQRDAFSALGGKVGAIVVMDASNGEVLAAANYPTYEPDSIWSSSAWVRYVRDTIRRPLTSRAIKDNFSPGSSVKPFVATAAYHLGTPLPETRNFVCTGSYAPGGRIKPISEHGSAHGRIDMAHAMRYSCNLYFSYLAFALVGFENAKGVLDSLGFDQRLYWNTGAYLNEYNTLLPAKSWLIARDDIAKSRLGIGQASVKVNPIHMATLMAGIANGGIFLRPTLELGRPLDTLRWLRDRATNTIIDTLLREPLLAGGTASGAFAGIEKRGIIVHGKTGTADMEPDGREPSWFISYGRKNGRTYAVVVAIQNREGKYAGTINAPMARRMFEALDTYGYFAAAKPTPAQNPPSQSRPRGAR